MMAADKMRLLRFASLTPESCRCSALFNSRCYVLGQQLYLSVNIVVLYQFMVTCIEKFTSKVETSGFSVGKKGSRLQYYIFMLSTTFLRRKEWICERRCHQVLSVHLHILRDFLPLNPSTTTVYAQSAFIPACILLSVCSLHFTHSLHITPGP